MLSLKKFGINYYNIFFMLIAVAALVLSIIAFTRKGESFGESFDDNCLKPEFVLNNWGICCKNVPEDKKGEMRKICWRAAVKLTHFGTDICACQSGAQMKDAIACDPGYNCHCNLPTGISYGKCKHNLQ